MSYKVKCNSLSNWLNLDEKFEKRVSISVDMLKVDHAADINILMLVEPPGILDFRSKLLKNKEKIESSYDLILTWDEFILRDFSKAQKFIFGGCWIDLETFEKKSHNSLVQTISFLTSNKTTTNGHRLRQVVYDKMKKMGTMPPHFDFLYLRTPPRIESKHIMFDTSSFAIIVENEKHDNWFTEKLIDCLVTDTVPIFWGCPNIGEYFNEKGFLKFDTLEELEKIFRELNPTTYIEMLEYVHENREKAKKYMNIEQRLERVIKKYIDG